jgi:3-methylcrotonyl-CoA carboxylase alpha subunit/geranyl-CoA carboxylase alpha subunit
MVTDLDLVEWQLRVARGEPLPLAQEQVRFSGHAIEVRLCAEDEDFTPHAGTVRHFRAPAGVRFDHALFEGLQVSPWYDSMLGKLIVHAPTRAEALDRLAHALDATQVLGLPTNRAFLAACLRHATFRSGQALIPFLAEQGGAIRDLLQKAERDSAILYGLSAVFSQNLAHGSGSGALACPFTRPVRLRHRGRTMDLPVSGLPERAAGVTAVQVDGLRWHAQQGGVDLFVEDASFEPAKSAQGGATANELRAPFNGKVIAVKAVAGASVSRGDTLLVIESMKLEHAIAAPRDALVQAVRVERGQQVAPGQVLVQFGEAP